MTRSRLFASIVAVAALAASAVATACERFAERISDACASVFGLALRLMFGATPAPVRADAMDSKASRLLTAASSFVERMVKRERPRIEARWAMCPSV